MTEKDILFFYSIRKPGEETLDETRRRFFSNPPEIDSTYVEWHSQLAYLFSEFKKFCDKNGIQFFLMGGSYIGAVRQGGIIPWDRDGDIGMTRENYNLLKEKIDSSNTVDLDESLVLINTSENGKKKRSGYFNKKIIIKGCSKAVCIDVIVWDRIDIPEEYPVPEFWRLRNTYKTKYSNTEDIFEFDEHAEENVKHFTQDFIDDFGSENGAYFIWGLDNFRSTRAKKPERILSADIILPYKTITFLGEQYPVCNDGDAYIEQEWGDIWTLNIPEIIEGEKKEKLIATLEANKVVIELQKEEANDKQ